MWKCALNTLSSAIEINKVIVERSVALETELSLKCAHCHMWLFTRHQAVSLLELVEAYSHTLNLAHASTHDLVSMRTCYQEIALAFMTAMSLSESSSTTTASTTSTSSTATITTKTKKINTQLVKATETVICALGMAQKVSNAMRNRMLLPGHKAIKSSQQTIAQKSPGFVQSDLLAYWVKFESFFIH